MTDKTILGKRIPETTRGILYICIFDNVNLSLTVVNELFFIDQFIALEAYANIPNPESQLVTGNSYEDLCKELEILHNDMKDKDWLLELKNTL